MSEMGNWEGHSILRTPRALAEVAAEFGHRRRGRGGADRGRPRRSSYARARRARAARARRQGADVVERTDDRRARRGRAGARRGRGGSRRRAAPPTSCCAHLRDRGRPPAPQLAPRHGAPERLPRGLRLPRQRPGGPVRGRRRGAVPGGGAGHRDPDGRRVLGARGRLLQHLGGPRGAPGAPPRGTRRRHPRRQRGGGAAARAAGRARRTGRLATHGGVGARGVGHRALRGAARLRGEPDRPRVSAAGAGGARLRRRGRRQRTRVAAPRGGAPLPARSHHRAPRSGRAAPRQRAAAGREGARGRTPARSTSAGISPAARRSRAPEEVGAALG